MTRTSHQLSAVGDAVVLALRYGAPSALVSHRRQRVADGLAWRRAFGHSALSSAGRGARFSHGLRPRFRTATSGWPLAGDPRLRPHPLPSAGWAGRVRHPLGERDDGRSRRILAARFWRAFQSSGFALPVGDVIFCGRASRGSPLQFARRIAIPKPSKTARPVSAPSRASG